MQTHPHHKRAVRGSLSLFINSDWLQKVLPKPSVMPSDSVLIFARCCRSSYSSLSLLLAPAGSALVGTATCRRWEHPPHREFLIPPSYPGLPSMADRHGTGSAARMSPASRVVSSGVSRVCGNKLQTLCIGGPKKGVEEKQGVPLARGRHSSVSTPCEGQRVEYNRRMEWNRLD